MYRFDCKSFLWNLGRFVVLSEVSFVKLPVLCTAPFVSVVVCWNSLSLLIADTLNVPLNAEFAIPVVLFELLTFKMFILSLTFKLCGSSVLTVTVLPEAEQVLINLGLRSKNTSLASIVLNEKSVLALTPVVLDSWITNPSLGSFAFAASLPCFQTR